MDTDACLLLFSVVFSNQKGKMKPMVITKSMVRMFQVKVNAEEDL